MSNTYVELYEKLSRLQWLLQRQQMQSRAKRGPAGDSSRGQGRVLAMLRLQPEISTKDLSYLLGIRQQSLNELLNKLEKAEYVTRAPSEADRRVMLVQLTEKGKEAQAEEPDYSGIFSCLNVQEQENFGEYLDRVIAALEAEIGLGEGEEHEGWAHDFRDRMGDERFEMLAAMAWRGRGHGPGRGDPRMGQRRGEFRGPRIEPDFDGARGREGARHHRPGDAPPPEADGDKMD